MRSPSVTTVKRISFCGQLRSSSAEAASSLDGKVQAARPAQDVAKFLARLAHGRRVDQRHEVRRVRHQRLVIERLVVVLERRQVDVSLQVGCLLAELEEDAPKLVFLGVDALRDEPQEPELFPLDLR